MTLTKVDYTIFFRELSKVPRNASDLMPSFYREVSTELESGWQSWLNEWRERIRATSRDLETVSAKMRQANPKYTWREWLVVPARLRNPKPLPANNTGTT